MKCTLNNLHKIFSITKRNIENKIEFAFLNSFNGVNEIIFPNDNDFNFKNIRNEII